MKTKREQYFDFLKYLCKKHGHKYPFKDEWERLEFVTEHIGKLTKEERDMFPDLELRPVEKICPKSRKRVLLENQGSM